MSALLNVKTDSKSYHIVIERGALQKLTVLLPEHNKILIVTDNKIPEKYAKTVQEAFAQAVIKTVPSGEESKSLKTYEEILTLMLEHNFTRKDAVIAVGGGVCGDLAGFCASCYMRGISFYNIPTSLLSQVDSSVGGKTAVNLCGIKNIVGTFYQPDKVIIDPDTLTTLPEREFSSGMSEVIKMAASLDKEFFEYLETADFKKDIEHIIKRAVENKIRVVSQDEKEKGLRKVLNFGHTIGHGIEVTTDFNHGESVGLGMLAMSEGEPKARIEKLLLKANLPTRCSIDKKRVAAAVSHDKKTEGSTTDIVRIKKIGEFYFEKADSAELEKIIENAF